MREDFKYFIYVEESHSYMSNEPDVYLWKLKDINRFRILDRCYSQIGDRSNCVICKNISVYPSGLTFALYISQDNEDLELEAEIIRKLNSVINGEADDVCIDLSLKELPCENHQFIRLHKTKDKY